MNHVFADRAERFRQGRALRRLTPRESHADLHGPLTRDPVAILGAGDAMRLAELIGERYRRMGESPFAFLRGAAALMAEDLARQPKAGSPVQACGDCHLMNFGAFATPEDNILFDINDFDETLAGVDFTLDVKRLAASVAVAAAAAKMPEPKARALAAQTVAAYRKRMLALALLSPLQIWHSRIDLEQELAGIANRRLRQRLFAVIAKARGKGLPNDDNFPHLVRGNGTRIADKPPTIFHFDAKADARHTLDATRAFGLYQASLTPDRLRLVERYRLRDIVFKAVGVGSVGTFCAAGLFTSADDEPLFLQVKEANRSVLERLDAKLAYDGHQGRRVVEGQRMMQAASDIFLGWTQDSAANRQFYIRRLKNRRLGTVSEIGEAEGLVEYARLCGRTLARAHARCGDPAVLAGYMGTGQAFDDALASFAMAYAAQTKEDHAALLRARAAR